MTYRPITAATPRHSVYSNLRRGRRPQTVTERLKNIDPAAREALKELYRNTFADEAAKPVTSLPAHAEVGRAEKPQTLPVPPAHAGNKP